MEKLPYKLTQKEISAFVKLQLHSIPRQEYKRGEIKLNFHHIFSTGEEFEANEDELGNVTFVLKRGGKVIFDFKDLSPSEFLTPSCIKNKVGSNNLSLAIKKTFLRACGEEGSGCGAEPCFTNFVSIGDMRNPKDIFALLHEIGHIVVKDKSFKKLPVKFLAGLLLPGFVKKKAEIKSINEDSKSERNSWAFAFRVARFLYKKHGVNLFEIFKDRSDIQELLYGCLVSHRMGVSEDLTKQGKFNFWRWKPKPEDLEFLKGLFDKERLQRTRDVKTAPENT